MTTIIDDIARLLEASYGAGVMGVVGIEQNDLFDSIWSNVDSD
jgi:hypothetical protein